MLRLLACLHPFRLRTSASIVLSAAVISVAVGTYFQDSVSRSIKAEKDSFRKEFELVRNWASKAPHDFPVIPYSVEHSHTPSSVDDGPLRVAFGFLVHSFVEVSLFTAQKIIDEPTLHALIAFHVDKSADAEIRHAIQRWAAKRPDSVAVSSNIDVRNHHISQVYAQLELVRLVQDSFKGDVSHMLFLSETHALALPAASISAVLRRYRDRSFHCFFKVDPNFVTQLLNTPTAISGRGLVYHVIRRKQPLLLDDVWSGELWGAYSGTFISWLRSDEGKRTVHAIIDWFSFVPSSDEYVLPTALSRSPYRNLVLDVCNLSGSVFIEGDEIQMPEGSDAKPWWCAFHASPLIEPSMVAEVLRKRPVFVRKVTNVTFAGWLLEQKYRNTSSLSTSRVTVHDSSTRACLAVSGSTLVWTSDCAAGAMRVRDCITVSSESHCLLSAAPGACLALPTGIPKRHRVVWNKTSLQLGVSPCDPQSNEQTFMLSRGTLAMRHGYTDAKAVVQRSNGKVTMVDNDPKLAHLVVARETAHATIFETNTDLLRSEVQKASDSSTVQIVATRVVTWLLGTGNVYKWDPTKLNLGGSEKAVVQLSQAWVSRFGIHVSVYGEFGYSEIHHKGVSYRSMSNFDTSTRYDILIVWRALGAHGIDIAALKANTLIHDVHDSFLYPSLYGLTDTTAAKYVSSIFDRVVVKSNFHAHKLHLSFSPKVTVIPNGLQTEHFICDKAQTPRDPFMFIYTSDYSRGLERLLTGLWPLLHALEPLTTLHVYYGMDLQPTHFQQKMQKLLDQPGVREWGRASVHTMSEIRCRASYHLYYTDTDSETDCISVRESALAGCIPILSSVKVFVERAGIHLNGDPANYDSHVAAANAIAKLLAKNSDAEDLRNALKQHEYENSWNNTALRWIEELFVV